VTRVAAGLSTAGEAHVGGREAALEASSALGGASVDLAFAFLSPDHGRTGGDAAEAVDDVLAPTHLVACVAQGVVGGTTEVETGPAVSVWAASLPGADVEPFHAWAIDTDEGVGIVGFPELDGAALLTLLADPYSFPTPPLLGRLNEEYPEVPVVGGLAVAGGTEEAQTFVVDGNEHEGGAAGAVLRHVAVRTVVSQGCAPIGRDAVVTNAEGNVVHELAGAPAVERLRDELEALPVERRHQAAQGLLAGLVIDENKPSYERGDYLMRGLLGLDEESGALAVGELVRVGQTLRFHVRDAAAADEDLREVLDGALSGTTPAGALLFTCNGRGRGMFGVADHDARALTRALDGGGVAGFFCGGEIGPVGGRSFLHGFTATAAVFLDE